MKALPSELVHISGTGHQFRLYFQMSKELFQLLCNIIEDIIGREKFKSEEFLVELKNSDNINHRRVINANECTSSGFVCREVKLATALRILGGGLALDMALLFDMTFANAYKIFHKVIHNWLSHELFCPIDGIEYCTNDEKMASIALQFCEHSSGIINGCIGALDRWVVKLQKPQKSDGVNNPQSFYSWKGYYAVNVQAIVDCSKFFLF
jgi:hypothetical protein